MLDSDVDMLYHYDTKRINETVKRNVERFPLEFCFRLTNNEYNILKSQFATSNTRGGKQKLPYAFTEEETQSLRSQIVTLNKNGNRRYSKNK